MPKKMYDILPPKAAGRTKKIAKNAKEEDIVLSAAEIPQVKKTKKYPKEEQSQSITQQPVKQQPAREFPRKKTRRFPLKEVLAGGFVLLLLLSVYGYIKLPKADIEIWPITTPLNLSEKITANVSLKAADTDLNAIPAQYIELEKESEQQFPATGSASEDGKATGTITVYNKISPAMPFTLVKGTHFLSDSGKYFVTLDKIVVPAMKNKVAGSLSVQVQAEQSGNDYNIGASKFSIPKLNGTSYYYSVYGQSSSDMTGGYTGKVKKVTSDDLSIAKDVVTKKLLDDAEIALKNSISMDQILLDGASEIRVTDASADAKANTVTDNFKEHVKVKASALVIKKQDVDEFIKNYTASHTPNNNIVLQKSVHADYKLETLDLQKGTMTFALQSGADTYQDIVTDDLIDLFSLRSADQVKEIVDKKYPDSIAQLEVNFWPFWVKKVPSDSKRIKVNLNFK